MGLDGADTSALDTYSDENANDPRYGQARERIHLDLVEGMDRSGAQVTLELKDGRSLKGEANVGVPARDTDEQWRKLSNKFRSLAEPVIGEMRTEKLTSLIAGLEREKNVRALMKAAG
jgi:hypothetical protein